MEDTIRVAELFAGVGGFRLGLEGYDDERYPQFAMPAAGPYRTVWANQWEPGSSQRQFAARCYADRFGNDGLVNADIHAVLDACEKGELDIPDVDMVVGGFPCQDYSVARTLNQAAGIEGKKGVLWWDIYRFLQLKRPRFCLLENVDRLLKSPAGQRGRDFAIILSCFARLGYRVEWRVVNSADYGFPQRRRRVFILALREDEAARFAWALAADGRAGQTGEAEEIEEGDDGCGADRAAPEGGACADAPDLKAVIESSVLARALPIGPVDAVGEFDLEPDIAANSENFGKDRKTSPFKTAGAMHAGHVATCDADARYAGPRAVLGDVLVDPDEVPQSFYLDPSQAMAWVLLKGAKKVERVARDGHPYLYSEGSMAFPDPLDRPSRTILTGEGGSSPSRFKHVVEEGDGRLRRLVPDELDRLQGFPKGWTDVGMSDSQRAFCMGNALVVGVVNRIGAVLASAIGSERPAAGDL